MPKKGHKAAARQAKLSQKKRRGKGAPQIFASGPVKSNVSVDDVDPQGTESHVDYVDNPVQKSVQEISLEAVPVYPYLGSELIRIGVVAGVMLVILAIMTVLLGS